MSKKEEGQKISKRFIVFLVAVLLFLFVYTTKPKDNLYIKEPQSLEEMLEYNSIRPVKMNKKEEIKSQINKREEIKAINIPINHEEKISSDKKNKEIKIAESNYNDILDSIANLQNNSINSIEIIKDKLVKQYGYPAEIIKIHYDNIPNIVFFDIQKGELRINREKIYDYDNKHITALIAKELYIFDKLSKICKLIGINEFKKELEENNISNINDKFWQEASYYAQIENNDIKTSKSEIKNYLNKEKLIHTSIYEYIKDLTENEKSAIEEESNEASIYIYNYYKIQAENKTLEELKKLFNEINTNLNNLTDKNTILRNEQKEIFDYYFSKTIREKYPAHKTNFIQFLETFNQQEILELLKNTNNEIKNDINDSEIQEFLKYKINKINKINTKEELKKSLTAYLNFNKARELSDSKTELECIIKLICIENELHKNSTMPISLYYIKIPKDLYSLYNITSKNRRFDFIYNNKEFKETQNGETEQSHLINLLNQNRIDN